VRPGQAATQFRQPSECRYKICYLLESGSSDIQAMMKHFNPTANPLNGVEDHDAAEVIHRPLGTNAKELMP
jgi:hypothetical protein